MRKMNNKRKICQIFNGIKKIKAVWLGGNKFWQWQQSTACQNVKKWVRNVIWGKVSNSSENSKWKKK